MAAISWVYSNDTWYRTDSCRHSEALLKVAALIGKLQVASNLNLHWQYSRHTVWLFYWGLRILPLKLCSSSDRCRLLHNTIILISHSEQVLLKTQNFFENLLTFLFHTQDQELKRKYLALLPPQQIIEICLTFDPHVPLYVKSTVWPSDINAAIAALQQNPPPSSEPAQPAPAPPMQPLQPPPQQPYGFSSSSAYPHNPYYPAHSTAYAYPHPAYTPYPPIQNGYPHPHVRPAYPSPSGYNNLTSLPPPPEGVSTDDLPSYEEMIVEALSSTTDPEGYAPKDLFTWMASRYPLQSNFRPSASQALQKAYKRGRFEKSSGGKYRLNPTWDGGNVRYIDSLLCSIDKLLLLILFRHYDDQHVDRKPKARFHQGLQSLHLRSRKHRWCTTINKHLPHSMLLLLPCHRMGILMFILQGHYPWLDLLYQHLQHHLRMLNLL